MTAGLLSDRSLARRIVSSPYLAPDSVAHNKVEGWLSAFGEPAISDALRHMFEACPKARALVNGLAEYSPHLWDLSSANPARLLDVLQSEPEAHFRLILERAFSANINGADDATLMRVLRQIKAEAALLIGVADIGGVWPITQVTFALTELADTTFQAAVRHLLKDVVKRGKLLATDAAHPELNSGYIVLAMGKMGAFELNYSSDADLIIFFDPLSQAVAGIDSQSLYIRVSRGLVKLLQERTADGYVFRIDVRLRPDPASTHIAISTPAAIEYYETRGQNWERSAMIKARPCAGDFVAGEAFLRELAPFVWRKSMDFAALADIHAMKRQIHAYKGHGEIAVAGHNIKLGRGGIREIEFFVQTQQLIAGGRHPELRDRSTLLMLQRLADGGWIAEETKSELDIAYRFLRTVEHRLQMVADEQTHTLPDDPQALERLARFLGFPDTDAFGRRLLSQLKIVQGHYARLFENGSDDTQPVLVFPKDEDHRETLDRLAAKEFRNPLEVSATIRGWLAGQHPALRSDFARAQLTTFIAPLVEELSRTENCEVALQGFDRFLARLPVGAAGRLFPMLTQNQDLLALVLLIIGSAPRLSDTLAHHPEVMDGLLDPKFFGSIPDRDALEMALSRSLDQSISYEDFLDRLRLFGQEHLFLIGARVLSGTVFAGQAGDAFARLAEVIVAALHRATEARFAEAHGRITGQDTAVLAMGKLGGGEMTAASDLDLILIYDFDEEHPQSDGARSLYGAQYFARLTQRLISALTAQTNYGALYQVDMRLRPSGRSGPVATQLSAFEDYQATEAWTWEHMALTRARVISGNPAFAVKIENAIRSVLCRQRDARLIADDAAEMRRALAREKGESDIWDLKYAAGGLIDVEFIAQYLQLVHAAENPEVLDTATVRVLEKAAKLGLLAAEDADVLRPAVRLYHDLSQILRLCLAGPFDPKSAGGGLLRLLTRAADVPDFPTLEAHLTQTQAGVRESFLRILR